MSMYNSQQKPQSTYKDMVAEFYASGGETTKCKPAHVTGNEAGFGTRWAVKEARKDFKKAQK